MTVQQADSRQRLETKPRPSQRCFSQSVCMLCSQVLHKYNMQHQQSCAAQLCKQRQICRLQMNSHTSGVSALFETLLSLLLRWQHTCLCSISPIMSCWAISRLTANLALHLELMLHSWLMSDCTANTGLPSTTPWCLLCGCTSWLAHTTVMTVEHANSQTQKCAAGTRCSICSKHWMQLKQSTWTMLFYSYSFKSARQHLTTSYSRFAGQLGS